MSYTRLPRTVHVLVVSAHRFHTRVQHAEKISAVAGRQPGVEQQFELDQSVASLGLESERVCGSGQPRVTKRTKLHCSTWRKAPPEVDVCPSLAETRFSYRRWTRGSSENPKTHLMDLNWISIGIVTKN